MQSATTKQTRRSKNTGRVASADELRAAQAAYKEATVRYAEAAAAVHARIRLGERPSREDIQREQEAKASLEAVRARYVELGGQA